MLFNRQGLQQKNWRMVKKGKHILFGCSLFFVVGGVSVNGPQVTYASENKSSELSVKQDNITNKNTAVSTSELNNEKQTESLNNTALEKNTLSESKEKIILKKEVNKEELKNLVDKIKRADISGKTEKSIKELNLVLSRAEKALDNKEITQEEIDKEVKLLKEAFEKLEDKPREDKKSEIKEKDDKSSSEKDIKEKQQENNTEDIARRHNEKITKATNIVKEINSLASEINYEFSDTEKELVNNIEKLPTTDNNSEESIQKLLNEAIYLRNRVANRVTRANSGRRDPRNGKVIDKNGESGFRAIWLASIANKYEGSNNLVNENRTNLTFYNSDTLFSVMTAYGKRGNGEPLVRYQNGPKRGEENPTPYYVKRVGVISGLNQVKGLKLRVAYKDFRTGNKEEVDIAANYWNVNNPEVQMALVGTIGDGGNVTPGTYHITIGANGTHKQNTITYTLTIKPQSERNTVNNLTPTYVDDIRHLTENEKNALIEKFKAEHPNVVNRANHVDFDHAEISADGTTMTIHFKDGFNPKTIQTNATNDVEAKHQSITAYFGDSKELYTNPRQLVRSKTGNEVPSTAQVTYKTPFNLQQTGTRNVVVTTTYENGITKDVTTPYTVLDFIGKQDKKINQNQSGQLGDARNYITVSDNSALPSELTVRWKGGSSTVDTSAAGVQHKEIEILRGNHLMKTVTIPVEIVDNINPTITAPDSVLLTRLEGLPSEINISAQDNNKGVGLKDGTAVTVENLPAPLTYNAAKSKIEINGVIPNNFQLGKSSIQVTVKAVDKKGNTATKNITFNIQSQTQKYTAVANPQKQEVSYSETPDAGTSIQRNGLPTGTRYGWATAPNTTTGPGDKAGVVTVTYPDGSTDTVSVTVKVRKLSDEHEPTGKTITVNQNEPVTNDRLKAAVTISSNGNSKVRSVTPVGNISTTNAGPQTIKATVTYLDNTTDPVDIPLEVKDITAPTIQTPTDRQNWDLIALDRTLPPIKVISADNAGGTGIKSTTVTGLPDFLVYDNATKTIKFKNGVQEVTKLPAGQDSKIYNVNIQVTDNSNNSSQRTVAITVKSMTTKYSATANPQKQTVSYGETPNAGTSINKNELPEGTSYTWRTMPNTTTGPGQKAGVVIVTYPDGSTDLVDVTVDVRKLSEEHEPTATKIVKNQNGLVSNADLKAAVTISNNGASKVKSVTPVGTINTVEAGEKEISAMVTYLDDTTDTVKIPLEVKDVTPPTIQTPVNGQNVDLIALDKAFSPIKVTSNDNAGGSGVQSTTVTDLPDFLTYDDATKTIKFKEGTKEVPKLPVGTDSQTYTTTIRVTDNANNSSTSHLTFIVKSMTTKYDATSNTQKQTVSYGETPDAGTSVNKTGLPEGTSYAWKTTPVTTDGPGEKDGVVEVTYKDGSKDMVNVKVTVKELSSEYEVTGNEIVVNQNDRVSNDDLKAKVTATSKVGNVDGTDKISKVEPKAEISTANYGDQNITATVTFKDGTTKEVTIPLKVKDVTKPTIQTPEDNTNWEMTALDKVLPNMEVRAEDNANGSGIKNVTVIGLPDYLEYDSATYTIKFKSGKDTVEKLPDNTPSKEFNLNIRVEDNAGNVNTRTAKITVSSISAKTNPQPKDQMVNYGQVPNPEDSVNKQGLPDGTTVTWKTPPVVNTPGSTTGEVEITYPDGSKDVVTVNVTVRKVSEEYTATGTQIEVNQNAEVTSDMLKGVVNAINAQDDNGNAKIAKVESKTPINTALYGNQTIQAKVTYIDGSEQDVTIPLKVKDVTPPTIQTPTNGQNWNLIAVEGGNPNIAVTSEDNAGGSGIKSITVMGLPNFLEYNEATKMIQFKTGVTSVPKLSEGTDVEPHNVTITVADNAGNETTTNVTITVKSMTTKYNATPNEQKQTVSYGEELDAGASINKSGLPAGTTYTWETKPSTTEGPGEKAGVVTVTYPDGSKDVVNVTVNVRKLSDEYEPTGTKIVKNQNDLVSNEELKATVTISNNGASKVKSVTPVETINTINSGDQTINATVTYLDGTTDTVTIPLEVKDVIPPTIQAPTENTNWEMTALDKTLPNMEVSAADNANGSGVKTVSVEGLPDYLEYDSTTNSIRFKVGKQEVEKLPENTPSKEFNLNIRVEDKAGNVSERTAKITVSSMSEKKNPTPIPQNTSYGQVPSPNASVDKTGLPEGTNVTWKTPPVVTAPGTSTGVIEVTYPDGSKDTVEVTVNISKLSDEYNIAGTEIVVNQNTPVTNDDLKAKVTAISKEGNINGTDKISKIEPKAEISTANYGNQNITATVTFKDGTTKEVTIPLKVKDITAPTIQTPTNGQNWDLIAVEGENPNIAVTSQDNAGGSGVKTTTVTGLPEFLEYNEATKMIQFKTGVTSVPKLSEGTDVEPHNVTITVADNVGNETTTNVTITVKSMTTKYNATPNEQKQTVSYGEELDAGANINKSGLPAGTTYTWETKPSTTQGPGDKVGVVTVTYPDGSKDAVNVAVNVRALNDEYDVAGNEIVVNQNTPVTNDELKAKVTAISKVGNIDGTDKISKVESKTEISMANYGNQNITATVTFKDGTTKEVTIPLKVKDVTPPTIQAPTENTNWEMIALDKTLPNMEVRVEDNMNGSGVKTVSVEGLPNYLEYDNATNLIKFKAGKQEVEKLSENTPSKEFNLNIRVEDNAGNVNTRNAKITVSSISAKTNPQPKDQMVNYGQTPNPEDSVNKQGLPDGTTMTWKTPPVVNTPGSTTGEVEITYPDGSKDVVTVNVTVRKVSEEYTATGTQIEVNQNEEVTSDMLKGAVNTTNGKGDNGNTKILKVESKTPINTVAYGDQTIQAKVTYIDGSEQEVTIPLKVKDVTDPTILTPEENKNWEITALDKTLPVMKIKAEDNANGSGISTIEVRNMPSFLAFDESTGTIVFKEGIQEVPKIKSDNTMYGVTIIARDKAGNSTSILVNITVWSMRGKYNPQPKPQTVDNGTVPNAEDSVDKTGLPEGTTVTWKINPDVSTPGSHPTVALVTYPDGTVDEVEVPITVKEQKDTFNPTAKQPGQTAKHGSNPSAEGSINTDGLPSGTTYTWVEKPDTHTMPGSKPGKVLITYPDNSTEEVTVTVEVTPQKDDYNPQPKPQTVDNGTVPNAEDSVDKTGLPEGTTVTWKTNPDVSTPGSHPTVALVTYPDGTVDEVEVPITVKKQSETFTPTAKEPNQTAKHGSNPSAEGSINTDGLPSGTTYTWVEKPDTNTTPGSKPGKVLITYPDNSTEEVPVTVEVTPQKDDYNPQPKLQTVDNGTVPNAEDSVDKTGLPSGTTIAWKTNPEVTTPGEYLTIALVTYPDGTVDEVTVPITVKKQSETFTPTAKQPNQTAKHGSDPSAEGSINTDSLPSGTTYTWVEKPDTNTTPGSKQGKVLITYPDNSTEEVTVTVEVTPQKDDYNPQPKPQTITNGDVPNAKDSIGNVQELPDGTRIEWKDGTVPNTDTPGNISAKITITYPDGTADEVDVTIIANKQTAKGDPEVQPTLPEFSGGVNGDPEVQPALPEFNGGVNGDPEVQPDLPEFNGGVNGDPEVQPMLPEFNGGVDGDPEVQPMLPEFSGGVNGDPEVQPALPEFNGGVNGDPEVQPMLPEFNGGVDGDPEVQPTLPEFNGGVNGEPEVQPTLPEFNGGVNGDPEVQPTLPEFNGGVNGDPEVQSTLPEFNGGVNGDPEVQPTLPEFNGGVNGDPETQPEIQKNKLIITRWIDENGNELKPVDAKASTKLGEENKAFDHGEIEGYEFIRTEVSKSGDVVTHIFRKRANNVINKVRVTQANSRNIDLVKSSRFSKTYKRLANTGETANNSELAGLGLAIVGLFAAIKRRKNEED